MRTLQEFNKYPIKLLLVLPVENKDGAEASVKKLGFAPDVYSPQYLLLDEATIKYCRANNIKAVPWTVNETEEMEKLKKFDLDGIITDYPNKAVKVFKK